MSTYRRPQVCAASIFFTVALADRQSRLLVDEVARLRWAVAATRMDRPFGIEAWVVLPDHMHCVWTLPWLRIPTHSVGCSDNIRSVIPGYPVTLSG